MLVHLGPRGRGNSNRPLKKQVRGAARLLEVAHPLIIWEPYDNRCPPIAQTSASSTGS
jgi:hypothetical protein